MITREIHNEFDQAQDRLLEEAKRIISANSVNEKITNEEKAERLIRLGFVNSEIVSGVENQKVLSKHKVDVVVKNKEQAQLIEYYKTQYPFQKFITESELDRICEKYNLIYAPVANYIKDVPEKNINEIENAGNLKTEDYPKAEKHCRLEFHNIFDVLGMSRFWAIIKGIPRVIKNRNFHSWMAADVYLREKYNLKRSYIVDSVTNFVNERHGLFIAAPKSHFNTEGLIKSGNFGLVNFTVTEIKDPIVFRYCRAGIQIISKWGLEANDETVQNPIEN